MDYAMEPGSEHANRAGKRKKARWLVVLLWSLALLCMVTAGGAAAYFFVQYRGLQQHVESNRELSETEVIERVNRIYNAPDEKPSLAQVSDQEKLSDQEFFQHAQKGDYVVVYPNAKIALLYRASSDKIINIGPISLDTKSSTQ